MKILIINCGSSSLKYQIIDSLNEESLAWSGISNIVLKDSFLKHEDRNQKIKFDEYLENHKTSIEFIVKKLVELKVLSNLDEIDAIGHRVVHGG